MKCSSSISLIKRKLFIDVDHTELKEESSYDVAAIRIEDRDEYGNVLPFSNDPVSFSVEGPIELIGPSVISLQGGMGGTFVKTTGKTGTAKLSITTQNGETTTVDFIIK